ncbi:hypothetical protein [Spiroplasma ixodetis]|uniref:hypothetical protein n=1 Tax=Spiroplasma ixodetis TaxID=2141 RepID=UPI0025764483|nr:hypothetical protein [Spiroplasma ixodetis]WJG69992.1 hypothetical protein SIXOD_v1c10050 [Spiroplasma ixodetis Y32]
MSLKYEKKWQQFKSNINNSLKLTTHKIALISSLLAVTTLMALLETPPIFLPFLKIDFGNTINLIALLIIKLPYSLLIAIIVPWLSLILPHFPSGNAEPIGEFAYMLSTITLLLLYSSFKLLFKQLPFWKAQSNNSWKRLMIIEIPTIVITCILVSLISAFYNWAFILDMYGAGDLKDKIWIVFVPFNLIKFTSVLLLYLLLVRPVQILVQHFNI